MLSPMVSTVLLSAQSTQIINSTCSNEVAENTVLITHDSDAENSDRELYIGMSNYAAGRMCGELVEAATADIEGTVSVMIFVGRLGQENADLRRQRINRPTDGP